MGAFIGLGLNINMNGSAALGGSGGGSPPPTVYVFDSFNRPDNASSLGVADTGQTWVAELGTWGIGNNTAQPFASTGSGAIATINSTVSDCSVGAIMTRSVSNVNAALLLRESDTSNFIQVEISPVAVTLRRNQSGVYTVIGNFSTTINLNQPYLVRVTMLADAINVFLDGVSIITANETFNQTATKHGFRIGNLTLGATYDDFRVEAL
jgi:hypothetical protein